MKASFFLSCPLGTIRVPIKLLSSVSDVFLTFENGHSNSSTSPSQGYCHT